MPPLPDPNFSRFGHGISLLGGWLPLTIQVVTVVVLIVGIGWRTRRWRLLWVPVSAGVGVIVTLAAWALFDPRTVIAKHGPYAGVAGYFDDSQEPADDKTKNLPDRPQQHDAPVGFGGHDDDDEFREKGALSDLCAAAVAVDIGCSLRVYPGYHTWQFAARAFANALPWLAQRVHTPGVGT